MILVFGFGIPNDRNTVLQNFQRKSFVLSRISNGKSKYILQSLYELSIVSLEVDIFLIKYYIYNDISRVFLGRPVHPSNPKSLQNLFLQRL